MRYPILITVPFRSQEERNALERKIIGVVNQDDLNAQKLFWEYFAFYPYYNQNSPLTPGQLYDILDKEFNIFLPEEALTNIDILGDDIYTAIPRRLPRLPVPTYYDPVRQCEINDADWHFNRIVVVVDKEDVDTAKVFAVYPEDFENRTFRRMRQTGKTLTEKQLKKIDYDSDAEDEERAAKGQNSIEDGKEDILPSPEYRNAAHYLGKKTAKHCRLRGINATKVKTSELVNKIACLDVGARLFDEIATTDDEL